ncbi:hypothetical protein ACFFLM_03135 [Deinococcus oregonensis]|uniref:Uncharacterized protein n=1 Tax=Deinococcus oregonensis TaxID=1805970 RepID=A0ABV6ATZ2_9DEIO
MVRTIAAVVSLPEHRIRPVPERELEWAAPRPRYSALNSHRAQLLPRLGDAPERYLTDSAVRLAGWLGQSAS